MRSGRLRHEVTFHSRIETQDATGDPVVTWGAAVATARAAIRPISGRELRVESTVLAEANTEIRMRYQPGITTKMRVVHGSTNYDILYIQNVDERNRELVLLCQSGLNNG